MRIRLLRIQVVLVLTAVSLVAYALAAIWIDTALRRAEFAGPQAGTGSTATATPGDGFAMGRAAQPEPNGPAAGPEPSSPAAKPDPREPTTESPPPARPSPRNPRHEILLVLLLDMAFLVLLGSVALIRSVVRPVEALSAQAERVARLEFGDLGTRHPVGRLGTSFRRMVLALSDERDRVQRQIEALERANRDLAEAQQGLVRSEKLATVGRLAAGLAHEIGNPLGGLIGYLEILKSRLARDAANAPMIDGALEATGHIDRILRDLLDFSRAGPSSAGPVALAPVVDEALRLCRPQKRFGGLELAVALPDDLPEVRADRPALVQVLVNLLLNAADAMDGEGRLELRAARQVAGDAEDRAGAPAEGRAPAGAHPRDRICLEILDTGPGLPPGHEHEVFEPFFTTKPPGQGTGLGLAIGQRLVETWGGRLEAANRPGGGAVFTLLLPVSAVN